MKILFDSPRLELQPHGGLLYVEHIVKALTEVGTDHEFILHTNGLRGAEAHQQRFARLGFNNRITQHYNPLPDRVLRYSVGSGLHPSSLLYGKKPDVVHVFGSRYVPRDATNVVLSLQDVIGLIDAENNPKHWRILYSMLKDVCDQARVIITISEFSKREISNMLDVKLDKIHVIANGVDSTIFHPMTSKEQNSAEETLKKFGLEKQTYGLFLGGDAERKNLPRLLQAFDLAAKKWHVTDKLVLVGSKGTHIKELMKTLSVSNKIVLPGYLLQSEVLAILQNAKYLVFPSLYEGFGLPPLEAMACGVPVVVTNKASVPEVVGDCGVYFDPFEIESIAESIGLVSNDAQLRTRNAVRGLNRSTSFTWHKAAQETLKLYIRQTTDRVYARQQQN